MVCTSEGTFGAFHVDQYASFATTGADLYVVDALNSGLRRFSGTGETSFFETGRNSAIIALASYESRLYSLETSLVANPETMRPSYAGSAVYEWMPDGSSTLLCEFQLPESLDPDFCNPYKCTTALCDGERMFLLFPSSERGRAVDFSASPMTLVMLEIATGKYETFKLDNASQLIALNGELLMYARRSGEYVEIVVYDRSSGAQQVALTLEGEQEGTYLPEGFWLDLNAQTLYYALNGAIYAKSVPDGPATKIGTLNPAHSPTLVQLDNGMLFACSSTSIEMVMDAGTSSSSSLTICNFAELASDYAAKHPGIAIQRTEMEGTALIDAILTQSPIPDVIFFNTDRDAVYRSLRDRGYLLAIDDAQVKQFVAQVHPDIVAAVTVDSAVCAVPIELTPSSMCGINRELWEAHALGNPPETWTEFAQLFARWPEIVRTNPDLCLFDPEELAQNGYTDPDGLRSLLLGWLIPRYEDYRQNQTDFMGYDTPLFREMMAAYEAVDFDALWTSITSGGENPLLSFYRGGLSSRDFNKEGFVALPLRMSGDATQNMPAALGVLVVNPYTDNPEVVVDFLHYAIAQIDPVDLIEMTPAISEPVRPEDYEAKVQEIQATVDNWTAQAESSEGEAQAMAEAELAQAQARLAQYQENAWLVPADALQEYRVLSDRLLIECAAELSESDQQILYDLQERYMNGDLPLEQYIQQLDQRIAMRELEG